MQFLAASTSIGLFVASVLLVGSRPPGELSERGLPASVFALGAGDQDRDGVPDDLDCAPADPTLWARPGEVLQLMLGPAAPLTNLAWDPPTDLGGEPSAVTYEVLRSSAADDLVSLLGCVELGQNDTFAVDPRTPPEGQVTYYVVRAVSCEPGSAGADSPGGVERVVGAFTTVFKLDDSGPGSLRQAVADASSGDLICIAEPGTLLLGGTSIELDRTLTLRGPGAELLTLDANALSPIFEVTSPDVRVDDMTLTNASFPAAILANTPSASVTVAFSRVIGNAGDGLWMRGTVLHTEIRGNGASGATITGEIRSSQLLDNAIFGARASDAVITKTQIAGNGADGIWVVQGSGDEVEISWCSIHDNNFAGVAIDLGSSGTVRLDASTIRGNARGIGSFGYSQMILVSRSTISGNVQQGAYMEYGDLRIRSSTISNNGSGLYSYGNRIRIRNSIIDGNGQACDVVGYGENVISEGHNIASDSTCDLDGPGDQSGVSAGLLSLARNGGPTLTHALADGSSALDAGSCPDESLDQRGLRRPVDLPGIFNEDDACDIGAVEQQTD